MDLLAGWAQAIITKSYATLKITYHKPAPLELHFYSKMQFIQLQRPHPPDTTSFDGSGTLIRSSNVELQYDEKSQIFKGSAPLEYVVAKFDGKYSGGRATGCTYRLIEKQHGNLGVEGTIDMNQGLVTLFIIHINPYPQETYRLDCPQQKPFDAPLPVWFGFFLDSHQKEMQGYSDIPHTLFLFERIAMTPN